MQDSAAELFSPATTAADADQERGSARPESAMSSIEQEGAGCLLPASSAQCSNRLRSWHFRPTVFTWTRPNPGEPYFHYKLVGLPCIPVCVQQPPHWFPRQVSSVLFLWPCGFGMLRQDGDEELFSESDSEQDIAESGASDSEQDLEQDICGVGLWR